MLSKRVIVCAFLLALHWAGHAHADDMQFADTIGWYVGGSIGQLDFEGEYDQPGFLSFLAGTQIPDTKAASASVYGGYHFNRYFGLEAAITLSGNLSEKSYYDASMSEIAFTPKVLLPVGDRFSFYAKGGLVIASYSQVIDDIYWLADDELYWGGIGLTAGVGMQVAIIRHLFVRFSYDYSDIELGPTDDVAYDGSSFYSVPDISTTINRAAIGMHYQF